MTHRTPSEAAYHALVDDVVELHRKDQGSAAIDRIREVAPTIPLRRADTAHLCACLLSLSGSPADALAELRRALDDGAWWDPRLLTDDDDLAPLRALAGFDDLLAVSTNRHRDAVDAPGPPVVRLPAAAPHRGVVVALHGADQDAQQAALEWADALDAGLAIVAVESSQRSTPLYRTWPDAGIAARDIAHGLESAAPSIAAGPVVAAGFSAGGRQAMLWALTARPTAPAAFVVVGPAITSDDLTGVDLAAAADRQVTGLMVLGELDDDVTDGALAVHEQLAGLGLPVTLTIVPGLGHAMPDDPGYLAARLAEARDRRSDGEAAAGGADGPGHRVGERFDVGLIE